MTIPAIVTVAITGNVTTKNDNPAVPITISEQIESTHEAFEAGAAVAHVHVRDDNGRPFSNPDRFAELQKGINKYCPGMIVQFSTGARGGKGNERSQSMIHKPEMASLSTGSVNLVKVIYDNEPALVLTIAKDIKDNGVRPEVEVFDLAHLYNAAALIKDGLVPDNCHVQFVMGIPGALPAKKSVFEFLLSELKEVIPNATWTATGTGRYSFECNKWSLANGGHVRTGLEDNVMIEKGILAASNAALVKKTISFMPEFNRHPASIAEARKILSITPYAKTAAA
jgi:uncharacterized protein (DUF849 family)